MILTGEEIKNRLGKDIFIEPFCETCVNPNSYNLRLHNELLLYTESLLDMKKANHTQKLTIPEEGFILEPGTLYLGRTLEFTKTHRLVPMLEGRSSIGRLGISVHITAGFGDVGFEGYWTLEIHSLMPVRVYPNIEICQIFYHEVQGEIEEYKSNKYQNNSGIQPSLLYKELNERELKKKHSK